jgi:hypothetical protein
MRDPAAPGRTPVKVAAFYPALNEARYTYDHKKYIDQTGGTIPTIKA